MQEVIGLVFLFGVVVTLVGLVASNQTYGKSIWGLRIARAFSWIGALAAVGSLLVWLAADVDGIEKRPCEKVGGVWSSELHLCLDDDKLPVIKDYK